MQLPNKLYSYENSTLALIPKVLKELQYGSKLVKDLYNALKPSLDDPTDFLSVWIAFMRFELLILMKRGKCTNACRNDVSRI